jgi:hypothetical protein
VIRRFDFVVAGCLLVVAVVHLLPVVGVAGSRQLDDLYGIGSVSGDVEILLRHRAVLLGLVGLVLLTAVWARSLRLTATAVGVASTASFIVIAMLDGTSTPEIRRVVVIDVAAVGLLAIVAVAETVRRVRGRGAGGEQPAPVDHAATSQR